MSDGPGFVHLHVHSDLSLLHGAIKLKQLVARCAELGMPAVALTDHGNLFGAVEFYQLARKAGVKPILGMEVYCCSDRHAHGSEAKGPLHRLVLLAEDPAGWQNLVKLASYGYLEGLDQGRPRVDAELLGRHRQGLIALSGGLQGEVGARLAEGDLPAATEAARRWAELFGPGNFYLEIQDHGDPREQRVRELAAELGREQALPLVATNNCHYLRRQNAPAHDVLLAVQQGRTVDDPTRETYPGDGWWLKPAAEMRELFAGYPDACDNTLAIADRCRVEIPLGELLLPSFPLPAGFGSPDEYLRHLSAEGATRLYGHCEGPVRERLDHELGIIERMGFAGYFLITGDFVQAAKDRGIPVGPGRGSAAGSLVCYALGITEVDPLAHDLLFERFLNPERISMPDIDIDFCFERREQVIDYVIQKYGEDCVCQIITFGKMLARGVLRDTGRAMGMGFGEVDRIAKMVPETLGITLAEALEQSEELRGVREEDPRYDRLLHTALELEGLHRHASIHAAGILIAPGDLTDHVPLYKSGKDEITTQWDMKNVEAAGLLKMDFLGLRTLTVIDTALQLLREGGGPDLQPAGIDLEDPAIYELLGRGDTVGVFQLESSGMQEVLRKLKPSSFEDITAVNALYRPGPLGSGMVDDFIDRKHGRKKIEYEHPMLEPILEPTYGVILYQEQVMRIAGTMGGFSMGEADTLRKAMGKKKKDILADLREKFVAGATGREVPAKVAGRIYDLMEYFAGYGFNKSHSACYAVLSAQTAWLKAHHPAAFMAATLSSEMNNSSRVVVLLEEVKRSGLEILPPDVNTCTADFRVVEGAVRFGLGAVKNVGRGAIEAIEAARDELGRPFRSLYEFVEEIDLGKVNKRVVEALVLAGATDSLPGRREQKLAALDLAFTRAQKKTRDRERGQGDLFGAAPEQQEDDGVLPEVEEWPAKERLAREKEAIGFYVSGHPLDELRPLLQRLGPDDTLRIPHTTGERPLVICAVTSAVKTVLSRKSNRLLAFVGIEDFVGSAELLCFPEAYERVRTQLEVDRICFFVGRTTSRDDEEPKMLLEKIIPLEEACEGLVREIRLRLPVDIDAAVAERVLQAVAAHPGRTPLVLQFDEGGFEASFHARRAQVKPVPELLAALHAALGEERVGLELGPLRGLAGGLEERRQRRRRPGAEARQGAGA